MHHGTLLSPASVCGTDHLHSPLLPLPTASCAAGASNFSCRPTCSQPTWAPSSGLCTMSGPRCGWACSGPTCACRRGMQGGAGRGLGACRAGLPRGSLLCVTTRGTHGWAHVVATQTRPSTILCRRPYTSSSPGGPPRQGPLRLLGRQRGSLPTWLSRRPTGSLRLCTTRSA